MELLQRQLGEQVDPQRMESQMFLKQHTELAEEQLLKRIQPLLKLIDQLILD